jgi:hypothetical protein
VSVAKSAFTTRLRYLLLHTHDWSDDSIDRLLGEAQTPWRRRRHHGAPVLEELG